MSKPLVRRLRDIETNYSLFKSELATLFHARKLITELWEIHSQKTPDSYHKMSELFKEAGFEVGQTKTEPNK